MTADNLDALDALAGEPLDASDEALAALVRELMDRVDPVPAGLADRVKFELSLAAMHAELAELQELTLAGVRGDTGPYAATESVTFTASRLSLMVTSGPSAEGGSPGSVRVDGWVTGGQVDVEVRAGDLSLRTATDASGRFVLDSVPRGPARFVLHPHQEGERPVLTPVIEL